MDPELFNFAVSGNEIELRRFAERNPNALVGSTPNGDTAPHIASQKGHTSFAAAICELCPSLLLRQNSRGDTALHVAARAGHLGMVLRLIYLANRRGLKAQMLRMVNEEGNTVLHEGARHNDQISLIFLVEEDPDLVLVLNKTGASALYVAAEEGNVSGVACFLEIMRKMENAYFGGPGDRTPLHAAVLGQYQDVIAVLSRARPEFLRERDTFGNYPIHDAALLGNLDIVKLLLYFDNSIAYLSDRDNRLPFHLAASNGHISIMEALLQRFPDSGEARDDQNWNALHIAVERGNLEVVRYILKSNKLEALINERNKEGNTPLHLAIRDHRFSVSFLLITDKRVDLNAINCEGHTAMDIIESNHEVSRKLEKILIWKVLTQMGGKQGLRPIDKRNGDPRTDSYKGISSIFSTLAGLIITVCFAAAFTIPGGYINDGSNKGKATLAGKSLLWLFIIADSSALFSSICVALLLFFVGIGDDVLLLAAISRSLSLMAISLLSLTLSFLSGISLVLSKKQAIVVSLICIGFFISLLQWLFSWAPILFLYIKYRWDKMISSFFGLCSIELSRLRFFFRTTLYLFPRYRKRIHKSEISSAGDNGEFERGISYGGSGVILASTTEGADENQLAGVGDEISLDLTGKLRKRMVSTEWVGVTPMDEKKKAEKKPKAQRLQKLVVKVDMHNDESTSKAFGNCSGCAWC